MRMKGGANANRAGTSFLKGARACEFFARGFYTTVSEPIRVGDLGTGKLNQPFLSINP
jgi:hypothetical protein